MKKSLLVVGILVVLLMLSANVYAASDDIDYVGKDLELKDGEMGIVSIGDSTDYVGKDMDLKDGEAGIISIEDGDAEKNGYSPYLYGGAALLLAACGGTYLKFKKEK